jgi:hypothetical protein
MARKAGVTVADETEHHSDASSLTRRVTRLMACGHRRIH